MRKVICLLIICFCLGACQHKSKIADVPEDSNTNLIFVDNNMIQIDTNLIFVDNENYYPVLTWFYDSNNPVIFEYYKDGNYCKEILFYEDANHNIIKYSGIDPYTIIQCLWTELLSASKYEVSYSKGYSDGIQKAIDILEDTAVRLTF